MQYFPTLKELNKKKIIVQLFQSWEIIKYYATPHFIRGYLCSIPSGFFLHQIKATPIEDLRTNVLQQYFKIFNSGKAKFQQISPEEERRKWKGRF